MSTDKQISAIQSTEETPFAFASDGPVLSLNDNISELSKLAKNEIFIKNPVESRHVKSTTDPSDCSISNAPCNLENQPMLKQDVPIKDAQHTTGPSTCSTSNHSNLYGMSLNERVLGFSASLFHAFSDFPNFDVFAYDEEADLVKNIAEGIPDSLLHSLQKGFRNCADLLSEERNNQSKPADRVRYIFANNIEEKLFRYLT